MTWASPLSMSVFADGVVYFHDIVIHIRKQKVKVFFFVYISNVQ